MEFCDCGRQAAAACTDCGARVCTAHRRYVPTPPNDFTRRDVELPARPFASVSGESILCNGCLDAVLASWASDLAASIRSRGLSPEDAALDLLTRGGWQEPYTGPRRAQQRLSGSVILAEAFGEAPRWAKESALKTAAYLYAQFQQRLGQTPPAHRINIWDRTPGNITRTETCRLWEIQSWDSDSGDVFLWVGERGGSAPAPSSLRQPDLHASSWDSVREAIAAASADPLLDETGRSPYSSAERPHLANLLLATVDARKKTR